MNCHFRFTLWLLLLTVVSFARVQFSLAADEAAESIKPGEQVSASAELKIGEGDTAQTVTMRYLLFVPKDYSESADTRWPLLMFLHGSGERGDDLAVVKKHGPPKLVDSRPDFPFVTVSPQCPTGERWQANQLSALIDHLEKTLKLDPERLYVTGLSMGGAGTWSLIAHQPKRFAAAIPICGGGGGDDFTRAELFSKLPIWAYYGDQDGAAGLKQCERMIAAIEATGNKEAHMTIYPNVGHDSWTETYANEDVYKWLLSQKLKQEKP
jgi:predicted peptidase